MQPRQHFSAGVDVPCDLSVPNADVNSAVPHPAPIFALANGKTIPPSAASQQLVAAWKVLLTIRGKYYRGETILDEEQR
jgi:hypothetical protein